MSVRGPERRQFEGFTAFGPLILRVMGVTLEPVASLAWDSAHDDRADDPTALGLPV